MNFSKSFGNIESHCTGPKEECNKGVMNNITENFAQCCANKSFFIIDSEAVVDAEDEVTNEGVYEETHGQN